jgi:hypothetical protein
MTNLPPSHSKQIASFLEKATARARLAFIVDATASRMPTWDMASQLQAQMFEDGQARRARSAVDLFSRRSRMLAFALDVRHRAFQEMARLSGGAHAHFEPGAAKLLGELLRAAAAFARGGLAALTDQRTDSARKLLEQMKKKKGGEGEKDE